MRYKVQLTWFPPSLLSVLPTNSAKWCINRADPIPSCTTTANKSSAETAAVKKFLLPSLASRDHGAGEAGAGAGEGRGRKRVRTYNTPQILHLLKGLRAQFWEVAEPRYVIQCS